MFARDVITQQAMEKHLLDMLSVPAASPLLPSSEEMTPECAEEFEQTCRSVAPLASLASLDLQAQFQLAMADCRIN